MKDLKVVVNMGQEELTVSWEWGHAWLCTPAGVQVALSSEGNGDTRWVSLWEGDSPSTRREVRVYIDGTVQRD